MFGATVGLPFALAIPLCLGNNFTIIGEIISTMFFCSGLVTLLQTTFGVRYVELLLIQLFCASQVKLVSPYHDSPGVLISRKPRKSFLASN